MITLIKTLEGNGSTDFSNELLSQPAAMETSGYRDLDTDKSEKKQLCGYDLFSLFTANIIRQEISFFR